jgi:2-C-methyl-D-erythritol 4-phosphate cytidylyltransferase/2-C-methyl-D-erythritol 2,4-cyclodiphosphate synthase
MRVAALVLAAGRGQRLGAGRPKALFPLAGKPLWARAADALAACRSVEWVLPVAPAEALEMFRAEVLTPRAREKFLAPIAGGTERQDSMWAGLEALPAEAEAVAVHDAARPLVSPDDVERVIEAADAHGAALLAVPTSDTIKRVRAGRVLETPPRKECFAAQTPQVFRVELLRRAMEAAREDGFQGTDDAQIVERSGAPVHVVVGQHSNIKITYPGDLAVAERSLNENFASGSPRVGHGFDAHRLVAGRSLRLAGVEIPFDRGLEGHSDGDVVLHAVASALLGAVGGGDLGTHFPSSDPELAGVDSAVLLAKVIAMVREKGLTVGNVDATVIAQVPRLGPHREAMQERLAVLLEADPGAVNLKVTSTDRLGAIGRGEGVAAQVVVLVRSEL